MKKIQAIKKQLIPVLLVTSFIGSYVIASGGFHPAMLSNQPGPQIQQPAPAQNAAQAPQPASAENCSICTDALTTAEIQIYADRVNDDIHLTLNGTYDPNDNLAPGQQYNSNAGRSSCTHRFHLGCLLGWVSNNDHYGRANSKCPNCRAPIVIVNPEEQQRQNGIRRIRGLNRNLNGEEIAALGQLRTFRQIRIIEPEEQHRIQLPPIFQPALPAAPVLPPAELAADQLAWALHQGQQGGGVAQRPRPGVLRPALQQRVDLARWDDVVDQDPFGLQWPDQDAANWWAQQAQDPANPNGGPVNIRQNGPNNGPNGPQGPNNGGGGNGPQGPINLGPLPLPNGPILPGGVVGAPQLAQAQAAPKPKGFSFAQFVGETSAGFLVGLLMSGELDKKADKQSTNFTMKRLCYLPGAVGSNVILNKLFPSRGWDTKTVGSYALGVAAGLLLPKVTRREAQQ